jgi:hypothetical protein
MAPKHHPTPLSGGDRKALQKELAKSPRDDQHPGSAFAVKAAPGRSADPGSGQYTTFHEESYAVSRDQICAVLLFNDAKMLQDKT